MLALEARSDLQKILSMVKELEPALSGDDGRNSSKSNSVETSGPKDHKPQRKESSKPENETSKKTEEDDSYSDDFNQPKTKQIHE